MRKHVPGHLGSSQIQFTDLPTLRDAAYGPPGTALIDIQMPAASYLPWGRENLGMGEGDLAQEIRRDLTLFLLGQIVPNALRHCTFHPFYR